MTAPEVRHFAVGLSAEAVAGAWARQEQAPAGAVVHLDREIAGRLRGGLPAPNGPAVAVVLRPMLAADDEDRLWAAALVVAHRTMSAPRSTAGWPDSLDVDGAPAAFVNVIAQLHGGVIDLAILTLRTPDPRHLPPADTFADESVAATAVARDGFDELAADYARCSHVVGRRVLATLLPRGETRGTATGLAADGRLRLESVTGMVELLAAAIIRRVEPA